MVSEVKHFLFWFYGNTWEWGRILGTSNWTGDYYISTAGIGLQVERQGKEAKRRSNLEEHAESRESNHANDLIDDLHAIFVRGLKVEFNQFICLDLWWDKCANCDF